MDAALLDQERRMASASIEDFSGDQRRRNHRTNKSPERVMCSGNCGKLRYASQLNKRVYRCKGCGG